MDRKLLGDGRAVTNKSHFLSKFITGLSNFSVQYNFQAIAVALLLMTSAVCTTDDDKCKQGKQASWVASTASAVVFTGAIFGQLSMGYLGDLLGRNKAMTLTLSIAAMSAMLSSAASQGSADSTYIIIIVFRFLLGVGLGYRLYTNSLTYQLIYLLIKVAFILCLLSKQQKTMAMKCMVPT